MNTQKPNPVDIFALSEEKLSSDTEFQSTLEAMSDEDKAAAIAAKRQEIINSEYARAMDYASNMKARAEKAEGKDGKKAPEKPDAPNKPVQQDEYQLTFKDNYALTQAQVHIDDIEEVVRFAKFSNITVAEALQDDTLQTIINTRTEKRKSAQAANKGGGKAGTKKLSPTEIMQNASKGNIPAQGSAEAEELFWARRGGRPS